MEQATGLREFLRGPAGRVVTIAFLVLALGVAGYVIWTESRSDPVVAAMEDPLFVDADSGKTFHVKLTPSMSIPVTSPFSGKKTGYVAELCYWTKDGRPKTEPTGVLLNADVGKPGPTFCPDCGRLVVHHNPSPTERPTPPPTEAEYISKNGG